MSVDIINSGNFPGNFPFPEIFPFLGNFPHFLREISPWKVNEPNGESMRASVGTHSDGGGGGGGVDGGVDGGGGMRARVCVQR